MQITRRTAFSKILLALVAASAFCTATPSSAVVIYREIFPNVSGGNETLGPEGWFIHSNAGGLAASQTNSPNFSAPNNLPGINSNPTNNTAAGQQNGYAFNNDASGVDYLFWTNEFTISAAYDVNSISWYQGNSAADLNRAAVQVGGQWYASNQTFANTVGVNNSITSAAQMTLSMNTATWRQLDFTPGLSLALGAAATLPQGDWTAFGWYTDSKSAQLRLDTFQIDATPKVVPTVVLYREIFPNNTTDNITNPSASTDTAWKVHEGSGALDADWILANNTLDTSATAGVAVNSNPAYAPLNNRSYLWNGSGANTDYLMTTNEYSVAVSDVHSVQWWQNNGGTTDAIQIALQVDSQWFVSNESFNNPVANVPTEFTLEMLGATWRTLLFTEGSQLQLGPAAALGLPDGTINAFGWYSLTRNATLRLDSFTFNGFASAAVPEPSTLGLLFFGGLGGALVARRSRRKAKP